MGGGCGWGRGYLVRDSLANINETPCLTFEDVLEWNIRIVCIVGGSLSHTYVGQCQSVCTWA